MIILSRLEKKWLDSRGGRNESDVLVDENGVRYILMTSGEKGKDIKVVVPSDTEILRLFNKK